MPQPTRGDVHVNAPLTNISIAFMQDQSRFISDKVFPNVPVAKKSDTYYKYPKGQWFRSDAQKRAPGTESAGTGYELDTDTYNCEVDAVHKDVADQIRANSDSVLSPDREATELVTTHLALKREIEWANTYFKTSVWKGSTTGSDITPSTKWNAAGATPIQDITAQKDSISRLTGQDANTLVLPQDVWTAIRDSADFLDRMKITDTKIVTTGLLAAVLEIDRVLIAKVTNNTAKEGATPSMSWLYTDKALLCYSAPSPGLMKPSAGYTFTWNGYLGAGGQGQRVKRFRMEKLASDRVEGEMAYDQKLVSDELGVFFNDVLA